MLLDNFTKKLDSMEKKVTNRDFNKMSIAFYLGINLNGQTLGLGIALRGFFEPIFFMAL